MPSAVLRDLERDPAQLTLTGFLLLNYAEAKRAFDNQKRAEDLAPWAGSRLMELVIENSFDGAKGALGTDA